ncbi:interferon gamma receptor 1 isoform X2 [Gymnodraco acuticeps]|uniref:Interferon gamma receptor 1 isoform X2 n=1 Tax=Gymnodraco acuticeps TaxID=8218 RepID=A0A6P8V6X3_GYMAC|nr:interferon gamma receptor 1 isoform X2 [Gymnodraco acuticeps]
MLMIGGAFTALLLLLSGLSAAFVPPPTNLTVSCTSPNVMLSWEFSEQQTHTEFKIDVRGSGNNEIHQSWVKERHFHVFDFIWKSEASFMDFYGVNVTAFQGGNRSKEAKITFTFNDLKTADKKCHLDFPDVDLVETDSGATLSFKNPLHYYEKLKQAIIGADASFIFEASSKTGHYKEDCGQHENCKLDIVFPADEEKCVTLKGDLLESIGGQAFKQIDRICAEPEEKDLTVALVVLLFVLGIVIVVIIIIIIKVRAWTMESPPTPTPLNFTEREDGPLLIEKDSTPVSVVKLCNNPVNTSVSCEEEEEEEEEEEDSRDNNRDNREGLQPLDAAYSDGGRLEGNMKDDEDSGVRSKEEEEDSTDRSRDSSGYLIRESVQPLDAAYSDGGRLEDNMKDDEDSGVRSKEEEEDSTDRSRDSSGYLSRESVQPLDAEL